MRPAEPAVRAAAQTLAVDAATAEVFAAFADVQIPGLLLRGPAVERRFYDGTRPSWLSTRRS